MGFGRDDVGLGSLVGGIGAWEGVCLLVFFGSTPMSLAVLHLQSGADKIVCALANGYGFSMGYVMLYLGALLLSTRNSSTQGRRGSWRDRLHVAHLWWVYLLTIFTQIVFQMPHNLLPTWLHEHKGCVIEWPFFSYGLSDQRWSDYHAGASVGLDPAAWLINVNDAGLGVLCLLAILFADRTSAVLLLLFRDATLFRETVEYMWDHHRLGYPHTIQEPAWARPHAIAILWIVNFLWLVAPLLGVVWAHDQLQLRDPKQRKKAS
jgi:hypothetical protein